MKRIPWRSWLWLLPLAFYLALTLYQIDLPGPNYDEAVEAKPAVQFLQNLPVEAHRNVVIHIGHKALPLMIVDYVGALNAWVLIPLFKTLGISVATMRFWPILVGAIILWLTWMLGSWLFGRRGGLMAATLLAVQPSFIFFARQGIYVTNTTIALMLGLWLVLILFFTSGRASWLWLAGFMAGLGLWAKFIMLWPLLATAILLPLVWLSRDALDLHPAPDVRPRLLLRPHYWAPALLAFLLGLSPFILFNLRTGATIHHFLGTLHRSYYGVENSAYQPNLLERWGQMKDFLRGDHFWYLGGNFADVLAWPAFLLAILFILLVLMVRWRQPRTRALALRGIFLLAFCFLIFLQTPLTPTALWYTHLAMFSPILALIIAGGCDLLFRIWPHPWGTLAAGIFVTVMALSGLRADVQYHQALTVSGGYAAHSDAVYRLNDELLARGITSPYALDWGFDAPLILTSQGRINPIEIFGYEPYDHPDPGFADRVRPMLRDPNAYFLVHAPNRTHFPGRREALQAVAQEMGIPLETIAIIRERSGAPHTEIWHPVVPK